MNFGGTEDEQVGARQTGVAVATVKDNEDPEKLGRVKVAYPWRDTDDTSDWARIATPMAGGTYGAFFLPEVGDQVLVAFEDGDIHHPFVIGSLWSGQTKPPENNASGDNDLRVIESRKGHRIELDDNKSEAKVTIETDAGHTIKLEDKSGSEKITIEDQSGNNTITLDSAAGEISLSGDKKISLNAREIELSAQQKVSVAGKSEVSVESKGKVDVASKGQVTVDSNGVSKLKSSGIVKINGTLVKIN